MANMHGAASGAMSGAMAGASFGPIGAAIGGIGGALLGGSAGDGGSRDARQAQEAQEMRQMRWQEDLAKHGVRWRVEDARRAGIHPAAALGMQPFSSSGYASTFTPEGNDNVDFLAAAGHDISRAVHATQTQTERTESKVLAALAVERAGLQNDLLRAQIAKLSLGQVGPPMVDPANPGVRNFGTSDAGRITEEAMTRTTAAPGSPHQEAGAVTSLGFLKTPSGYQPVPSKDAKERMEDMIVPEMAWGWSQYGTANLGMGVPPPETWLPKGAVTWRWSHFRQEWQPEYRSRREIHRHYPKSKQAGPSLFHGAP